MKGHIRPYTNGVLALILFKSDFVTCSRHVVVHLNTDKSCNLLELHEFLGMDFICYVWNMAES